MPVANSFVISNRKNNFEATMYQSRYVKFAEGELLPMPSKDFTCLHGIFHNEDGFFIRSNLFEVLLIDEFLRYNHLDPRKSGFYQQVHYKPRLGLYLQQAPVDRYCATDECHYRAELAPIDPDFHMLCITRTFPNDEKFRSSVLLVGMNLGRRDNEYSVEQQENFNKIHDRCNPS